MMFQSFILGNLVSLCMKIIHSVVVVGLYYGFLTTFSIGPSYLFLLRAQVMEEGTEKKVSATTGFITGQFMIFISIYYAPLHLALGRPHTITVLALPYLLFQFFWKNHKHFFYSGYTTRNSIRNFSIQCLFLNNLIFQLFNHFILPSSMLARLVKIYMFRCNNKILFVTSSFVGWLIGHILFMKWLGLVLVWIRQNNSIRSNGLIRSNKYLVSEFRNSMARVFSILLFITCVYYLGRIPSPILTKKLKETQKVEERVEKAYEKIKETKQKKENRDIKYKKIEKKEKEKKSTLLFEKVIVSLLFDSKRWNRPLRYIKTNKLDSAVRNEMLQYIFAIPKSGGKETISFTYPPLLTIFLERVKSGLCYFIREKTSSNEFYNSWFYLNNENVQNFHTSFINRIQALDNEYQYSWFNILERKANLCNDDSKKKSFSKKHDPLLNGSYRKGKNLSASIDQNLNKKNFIAKFGINKIHGILSENPYFVEFKETKIFSRESFDSLIFIKKFVTESDPIDLNRTGHSLFSKVKPYSNFFGITDANGKTHIIIKGPKTINKKVPRWLYKLTSEVEQQSGDHGEKVSVDYEIRSRKAKRVVILTTKKEDTDTSDTSDETNEVALIRYPQQPDFRRDIIKGSIRAQRRKIVIWELLQANASSPLFLYRIQKKTPFSFTIYRWIQPMFVKWVEGKALKSVGYIEEKTNDKLRIEIAETWDNFPFAQVIRGVMLLIQSIFRKYIILPSLIFAKNIGRILLFQRPEWYEDLQEWNREMYVKCTYNGVPLSETEFPKNWLTDGIQIKIVFPFYLKPWHKSKLQSSQKIRIKNTKDDFCFLTIWGMESEFPFGSARKRPYFFKPIFKELEKKKKLHKEKIIRFFSLKEIFKSSERKVTPHKNDVSPQQRSKKLKKKREILQRKNAQLINKFYLFFEFFFERIYTTISFYIINISKMNTELFLDATKRILAKSISNHKRKREKIHKTKNNPMSFISTRTRKDIIVQMKTNSNICYDVSYVSQAYVFYKLSQLSIQNSYKSVYQYKGIRSFVKKDSFEKKGMRLVHWKLKDKTLPSYFTTQWKKWLRRHYQYDLSEMKQFLLIPQKRGNKVHQRHIIEKENLSKLDKDQFISLKKEFKIYSLSLYREKDHFEKNSNYNLLAYKFLNSEKEFLFSRWALEENNNRKIASNIYKETLFEMLKNRPILNFRSRILDMKKGADQKNFNKKILNFDLRKKDDIESWLTTNINRNKNTQISTNNCNKITKKSIFFLKLPEKNRKNPHQGFFDWMGMNAERLKDGIGNLQLWFFSEFVFLSTRYKKKPWFIPSKLLLLNWNSNDKNMNANKKINEKNKGLLLSQKNLRNKEENQPKNQIDLESVSPQQQNDIEETSTSSEGKKIKQYKSKIEAELDLFLKRYLLFQLHGNDALTKRMISNIKVYCLLLKLMDPKKITLYSIQKRGLSLDIMLIHKNLTLKELMKKGVFIIEPIRLSVQKDGQFFMYQTITICLVHKSKHQTNKKDQDQRDHSKSHPDEVISTPERITPSINKNCDWLIPENILSLRRCRTFRILIYFNSKNRNDVEKNTPVWTGKSVKNSHQVSHHNNDLDTDKSKLMKLTVFLWPNFRLEDLACMNRYWFNTTNGSRFTMLRLQVYSQLKTCRY
nr:hypothetical chloroplast RF19 [Utricularia pubescens]